MTRSAEREQLWLDLCSAFKQAGHVVLTDPRVDTDSAYLEGVRHLARVFAGSALYEVENHDPAYPHFTKLLSPWIQWGYMNPDFVYLIAPTRGDYTYRIFGQRGTAHILAIETFEGYWSDPSAMRVFDDQSALHMKDGSGELAVGTQGEVEVILSAEKHEGNWLKIPPGEGAVVVRQIFYDWETEDQGLLDIERVGATYPPPETTADELAERLQGLIRGVLEIPTVMARGIAKGFSSDPSILPMEPLNLEGPASDEWGFRNQYYAQGHYRCGPEEAVILDVKPPACAYWGFHLMSQFWEALDWQRRQTSINAAQATLDHDGVFRAVIAHRDPGVPNWLDTGGHTVGLIGGRYNRADTAPIPALRTVPFDKVRDELPSDTPTVSPAERSAAVRRRMLSVRRRMAD